MASHTDLLFGDQARGKLLAGASALADAVAVVSVLLLTEVTMIEVDDPEAAPAMPQMM